MPTPEHTSSASP
jgi:hypothetical protein